MAAPKVGYEQDGYRFKGGNPADPSNWEKLPPEKGDTQSGYRFLGGNPADPQSWGKLEDEGGFWSTFFEKAKTLGMADEAAAFAKNPTEANRKAFLAAGESKKREVGFGEGADWVAFKQMLGGSLGSMVAPAAAGLAATPFTSPVGGLAATGATLEAQYTTENLLRQAHAQDQALRAGKAPEAVSVGKAALAAAGQTGLDLLGGKVFSGVASKFPFMRPLLGESGGKAAREAGEVLEDAIAKGNVSFARGVARGVGHGIAFEVPQEIVQQGLERWQAGLSLTDDEALGEYGQAAIGAALLGGAFGGVSGAFEAAEVGEGAPRPQPTAEEAPPAISPAMDEVAARAFTNPEDKAAFEALTKQFSEAYGIPEDDAARLAFGAIQPTAPAAEEQVTTPEVPDVIPPIETVTPEAQLRKQLAEVAPPPVQAAPVEAAPAPAVTPPAPVETAPVAEAAPVPAPEVAPAVEPTAPVAQPNAIWANKDFDQPVTILPVEPQTGPDGRAYQPVTLNGTPSFVPADELRPIEAAPVPEVAAPEPVALSLPEAKKKVTPERITAATEMLNQALATPDFEGVEITPKEINKAAQKMARTPGLEAPAALTDVLGIDAMQAAEVAPEPVVVEPTPEPVLEAPTEIAPTEVALPEEAAPPVAEEAPVEPVAEEPMVPVTKVEPGEARGARPVQRGTQGVVKGRPVEGAAELTAGMQDEQALTERLRNMRNANLISDRDAAEVLGLIRPPASAEELNAMPPSQQGRWQRVLDLTRDMNEKAAQRDGATGKTKAQLNDAVKALDAQIDEVRSQLAKYAMGEAAMRVEKRKADRAQIEEDYKSGEINRAERDRQLAELRVDPLMGEALQEKWYKETDPAEAAFVESGIEGKSFEDALQWVTDNAPNEAYRTIAEAVKNNINALKRAGWKFDFRIAHEGDLIPASMRTALGTTRLYYGSRKGEIILHGADITGKVGTTFETFLHEAIHAAAMPLIKAGNYKRFGEYRFARATQDLFDVFNHVVREFNKKVRGGEALTPLEEAIYKRTTNTLQNPDEILAWAMTSPEVMAYLDTIPYTSKQTVFSRIVEIVRKVLGLAKNMDSALAEVLRAGEALLDTSAFEAKVASDFLTEISLGPATSKQQVEADQKINKGLFKAQQANKAAGLTEGLDEVTAGVKLSAKEKKQALYEAAVAGTLTPLKLKFQPTSWIRDAIDKMRPGLGSVLNQIDKLEQGMRGMRTSMERAMQRRVGEVEKFVNDNGQAELSTMMTIARVYRVDVTAYATREEALKDDPVLQFQEARGNAKGARKRTEEINTAWDAWEKLGKQPGGHETYKKMRQFYKDMYAALRSAQDEDIRNLGLDKESTERLIREARGDIDEDAVVEEGETHSGVPEKLFPAEYFPFRRFGEYVLIVQTGKRAERERYHFESIAERNLFAAKRAKELGLKRGTDEYKAAIRTANGLESFRDPDNKEGFLLSKLFAAVEEAKIPEGLSAEDAKKYRQTLKDRLYQTYLMTLPERSLRKQFIHAELVTGQSADVLRVFRVAAAQYAAQLPKVAYGGRI